MGLFAGYAIYRMRMSIILVTIVTVGLTIAAMALGPFGATFEAGKAPNWATAPIAGAVNSFNASINKSPIYTVLDPTNADPRIPAVGTDGKPPTTPAYNAATGEINVLPSFLLASLLLLVFSYIGANTAIWRFAQPVNYIGFWITAIVILVSAVGAVLAPFTNASVAAFKVDAFKGFAPTIAGGALQPLWPMLFV